MGCLKLTYDYPEQGEKNDALDWRVWRKRESDFLEVGVGGHWSDQYRSVEGNFALMCNS